MAYCRILEYSLRGVSLMSDGLRGYEMSLSTAERFFSLCKLWNLKTYEDRMALLNKLIHEEDIKILDEERLKKRLEGKRGFYIE
jgi:hypothetical protein